MTSSITHKNCPLAYTLAGSGPPILFIQGVGIHGNGWLPQTNALQSQFICLTFDNRGIGQSQWHRHPADVSSPAEKSSTQQKLRPHPFGTPITVEQMTEDTLAIMDAAGFDSAHIVAHSLGGLVALHLALTARPRVKSLSLLCTFADGKVATKLTPKMFSLGTRSRCGPKKWRRRAFLEIIMPPAALQGIDRDSLAAQLAPLFGHDLGDMPPVVNHQLNALKHYNATPHLPQLEGIPTLILAATQDPIARPKEGGQILHQKIPNSKYIEYPNASHGLPIQFPEKVNTELIAHISQ